MDDFETSFEARLEGTLKAFLETPEPMNEGKSVSLFGPSTSQEKSQQLGPSQPSDMANKECAASCRDDRESGLDKEIGERKAEGMRDNGWKESFRLNSTESLNTFYSCGTDEKQGTEYRDDLGSIVSGTRTDGDYSDNEAMSNVYGLFDFWTDMSWDSLETFDLIPPTDEMQGTKNRDDIDSIISGTNTDDNCSENDAISSVFGSNSSMQRPGNFSSADKRKKLKGDARGDIASASRHYESISGAYPEHRAGYWMGSLPQEQAEEETMISEKQEKTTQQLPRILPSLFEDVTKKNEQVLDMKESTPNIDLHEQITAGGISERTPDNIGDITHLDKIMDKIEEDLPIKCREARALTHEPKRSVKTLNDKGNTVETNSVSEMIVKEVIPDRIHTFADQRVDELEQPLPKNPIEPRSLTSQPIRSVEILEGKGNTVKIHYSAPKGTFKEIVKEHAIAVERDEPIEELPADDFKYAASYKEVGHAMITVSQPSGFQSMKSLPGLVNVKTMLLENGDASSQLPYNSQPCEDGTEQDERVLDMKKSTPNITSHEVAELSEPPTISKESLSQHFGKSLDEAREIFSVSRTEFKKMCRDVGIKRWQYGKRKMGSNSSSKHRRRPNNEEPGRTYSTDMPRVHDLPAISCSNQVLSTMDIKAMHNNLIIRFELPELSGISELEDKVIKRLHLDRDSFRIKYEDDGGHWVSITCDEDVRYCMKMSRSWKKKTINMLVDTTTNQ